MSLETVPRGHRQDWKVSLGVKNGSPLETLGRLAWEMTGLQWAEEREGGKGVGETDSSERSPAVKGAEVDRWEGRHRQVVQRKETQVTVV